MQKYSLRKFINDVHLWLGLASGIVLFLVCLSGTLLVFEDEIKSFFTDDFVVEATEGQKISIELLSDKLKGEGDITAVTLPATAKEPYLFSIKTDPKQRRGSTYYVNPYTGEYQKELKSSLDGFFMTMFRLHRWLLLDIEIGRPIVGIATIIFLILSISGIVLWFPKRLKWKNFKPGFKIKFSANWKRINHDLHNTLGFYACIVLVIMCLTGLCWSFQWYRDAGSAVLGAKIFGNRGGGPKVNSSLAKDAKVLSVAEILEVVNTELAYEGQIRLSLPKSETEVYTITKNDASGLSPAITDKLVLDQDGTVLKKEIFNEKPLNVQVAALIRPLHLGDIYGSFSKTIYFLACLIATSLPITGTLIWWNKLQKKRKRKKGKALRLETV
ncbi:PepSY-associated TM helix domain-containing protein [Zobellia uliginosa]|uniref:PepSY-associated TM helix domain-containing protein n=1 Tax=Zobellia uliginosa TaxID=143224 RepID=UPI0026E37014|nr:PepSY-associated TM helix domain-containing protein [Zobellia uliginosa]MDO6517957.1 PepSY-associated TM helix domain-containing protein [Zobellia uliginosa]